MLAARTRLFRLLLLVVCGFAALAWPTRHSTAYAAAAGDDDDDDSASGGGDDDDGGSAKGDDGGGDDDDDTVDADQPLVTAGGLFTKKTYPVSLIDRPLTLIEGMSEVKVGIGTDISAGGAFESWALGVFGHYGIADNQEIQFDVATALNNWNGADFGIGYEGAISYDLVDFRTEFVLPITKTTDMTTGSSSTDVAPGIEIGFPVKYRLKPQVAIIAIRNLMTINFKSKPDLTPTVGGIFQPVPQFAVIAEAGITIKGFNTDAGNFLIPVSVAAQLDASNAIDLGLAFSFPNLKPAKVTDAMGNDITPKFYDSRALLLYANLRF